MESRENSGDQGKGFTFIMWIDSWDIFEDLNQVVKIKRGEIFYVASTCRSLSSSPKNIEKQFKSYRKAYKYVKDMKSSCPDFGFDIFVKHGERWIAIRKIGFLYYNRSPVSCRGQQSCKSCEFYEGCVGNIEDELFKY